MNKNELSEVTKAGSDAGAVAALIAGTVRMPIVLSGEEGIPGRRTILVPRDAGGYDVKEWKEEEWAKAPRLVEGLVKVVSVESLLAEMNRWPQAPAVLLVNRGSYQIEAVLNPHTPAGPGWGNHRVACCCPLSDDLQVWMKAAAAPMTHEGLADFLEEAPGIVSPAKADLLGTVQEFRTCGTEGGSSKVDPRTGNYTVSWESGQKTDTELPELSVKVRAFEHEAPEVKVRVWLRPRVKDKKLTFEVRLSDLRDEMKKAWAWVVNELPVEVAKTVLWVG